MSEKPFNPFRVRRGIFVRILRAPGNQRRVMDIGYVTGVDNDDDPHQAEIMFGDGNREAFERDAEFELMEWQPVVHRVIRELEVANQELSEQLVTVNGELLSSRRTE